MNLIAYIGSLVVVGFIIGGLGRLVIPGPNPIGWWKTLEVGVAGAFVGGVFVLGLISVVLEVAVPPVGRRGPQPVDVSNSVCGKCFVLGSSIFGGVCVTFVLLERVFR
jgi:uncharacterized membrane protein YeaQ/YmgE (transglycosylase-associated protein family)